MDFNDKKILITGGTGFLGANIIYALLNDKGVSPDNIRVFYVENSPIITLNDFSPLDMFHRRPL